MTLSICIPSIVGRESNLERLTKFVSKQSKGLPVELITDVDNKDVSIGVKRDRMYNKCVGKYAVQIDDDDWVSDDYVSRVLSALEKKPDCVGYAEKCIMDGIVRHSSFSKQFDRWQQLKRPDVNGFIYYRTPFTKSPIRTELCQMVGVSDMRFGEDHDFARRIHKHLKTEVYIDQVMYFYSANSLTKNEFNKRYGIK